MGKKEKKTDALRRDDPKENNWEIPETEKEISHDHEDKIPEPMAQNVEKDILIDPEQIEAAFKCPKGPKGPAGVNEEQKEDPGIEFMEPGLKMSIASQVVGDVLIQNLMKVDAELRRGNPVWHWCLADDHCTFVFRNGQKVTVKF